MASFYKRGGYQWGARIRRRGFPVDPDWSVFGRRQHSVIGNQFLWTVSHLTTCPKIGVHFSGLNRSDIEIMLSNGRAVGCR